MKFLKFGLIVVMPMFLSACLYGQCFDGPCALEHERILNSIKAYGEYFEKPGMTKEGWRADWVACGGTSNGDYSSEAPSGSSTSVLLADSKKKAQQLSTCMQSKGYHYQPSPSKKGS